MRFPALVFLFLFPLFSRAQTPGFPNGPRIKFDFTVIVDTIRLADLDSTCGCVRRNRYVFPFVNAGNEPLVIGSGEDPDSEFISNDEGFTCYYPKHSVRPGQRDSIVICGIATLFRMDLSCEISSNSVVPATIRVKRVKAFTQVPPEWRLAREKAELKKVLRAEFAAKRAADSLGEEKVARIVIHPDSLPEAFRKTLALPGPMLLDSSTQFLCIERIDGSQSTRVRPKGSNYRPGTMAVIRKGKTKRWYDWNYRVTRKEKFLHERRKENGWIERTYRVKEYENGKKTKRYRYTRSYPPHF